jgi:hypothetical protein
MPAQTLETGLNDPPSEKEMGTETETETETERGECFPMRQECS